MADDRIVKVYDLKVVGSQELLNDLDKINKAYEDIAASKKKISEGNSPSSGGSTSVKKERDELERLTKQLQKLREENALLALQKKEEIRIQNIKNKLDNSERNSLERAQLLINQYTAEKRKLNLATEEGTRLNDNYNKAIEKANRFIKENADVETRRFKNIGNYQGRFDAMQKNFSTLSNTVTQVTRELPAFTNSVQTGFMGISNNLGPLADAFKKLREEQKLAIEQATAAAVQQGIQAKEAALLAGATKEAAIAAGLQAENQAMANVATLKANTPLKQLASAVFSWNTLLSVGITLLTVYGAEIFKWVKALFSGKEAMDTFVERQEILNEALRGSEFKKAVTDIEDLRINIDLARKGIINKTDAVNQYNKSLGETMGKVQGLDEAEKNITKNGEAYIKMTLFKAAANIALQKAADAVLKAEEARQKSLKDFAELGDNSSLGFGDEKDTRANKLRLARENAKEALRLQKERRDAEVKINEEAAEKNRNIAVKLRAEAAAEAKKAGLDLFGSEFDVNGDNKAAQAAKKAAEERKKYLEEQAEVIKEAKLALLSEQEREEKELYLKYEEDKKKLIGASNEDKITVEKAYQKELKDIRDKYAKAYYDGVFEQELELIEIEAKAVKKKEKEEKDFQERMLKYLKKHNEQVQEENERNFKEAQKKEKEREKIREKNQEDALKVSFQLLEDYSDSQADIANDRIEREFNDKERFLDLEKEKRLSLAQSAAEKQAIEEEYRLKNEELERQRNIAHQEAARKKLAIDFALASIKAIVAGFDSGGIAGAIIAEAIALGTYLIALNNINAQQFAKSGKVLPYTLGPGLIDKSPNTIPTSDGDNVLAYVKPGEVILNEQHQAMLGGNRTFASIGVPGFGSSVQPPVFSSYYATSTGIGTTTGESSVLYAKTMDAIIALNSKVQTLDVRLDPHAVGKYLYEYSKNVSLASI